MTLLAPKVSKSAADARSGPCKNMNSIVVFGVALSQTNPSAPRPLHLQYKTTIHYLYEEGLHRPRRLTPSVLTGFAWRSALLAKNSVPHCFLNAKTLTF